jgi:hypothetical protein
VLKLSPALVIDESELLQAVDTVAACIRDTKEEA